MKKLTCMLFALFISLAAVATEKDRDDPKYPVRDIDATLLENAHAVVRKRDVYFTVEDRGKTIFREHRVITILNEKAKGLAYIVERYDPLTEINDFEAIVYNNEGIEIDKLRKSDIKDESMVTGAALYQDARIQYADMTQPDYPYTVEFITEREVDKYYETPDFNPLFRENISIESSSLTLKGPEELIPRFRAFNFDVDPEETIIPDGISLRWEVSNLKAVEREPLSEGLRAFVPFVETAPSIFEYDGYAGDMNSWENFGRWIWKLNEGRGDLPESVIQEVRRLTEGLSDREKAKVVYEYMQNRTRYVNISMGIGALQPFEASVVNSVGYGDCKALSNYTITLLKAVGLDAHYVLIWGGSGAKKLDPDFPVHAFNHAIVNIPMENDTVWLECTSQTKPFDYMGTFTGDRQALMITEEGGVIVKTPDYSHDDNQRIRNIKVIFDEVGNAKAVASSRYKGLHYDLQGLSFYLNSGEKDQKDWILENTEISNLDLKTFHMENLKASVPTAVVDLTVEVNRYASKTGKRFYFVPNLMSQVEANYKQVEDRKTRFISEHDLTFIDTVEYSFSSGYQLEYLPEPVQIESAFGRYETRAEFIQGKLIYYRRLEVFSGEYPPDKYDDFIEFAKEVESQDKTKVVFTTKT